MSLGYGGVLSRQALFSFFDRSSGPRQDFTVWSFDGTSAAKSTVGKILPFPNEAGASLGAPFVLALGSIQTPRVWMEEEEFYCPSMRQCEHCLMTKQ